jgi:hypothetical protein
MKLLNPREIMAKVGREAFPDGGQLACARALCGKTRAFTTREAGRFLSEGWPKCCDQTMKVTSARQAEDAR